MELYNSSEITVHRLNELIQDNGKIQIIDVREDINYKIMEIVQKHKSDFAFPSSTVCLEK